MWADRQTNKMSLVNNIDEGTTMASNGMRQHLSIRITTTILSLNHRRKAPTSCLCLFIYNSSAGDVGSLVTAKSGAKLDPSSGVW